MANDNLEEFLEYFKTTYKLFWPSIESNRLRNSLLFNEIGQLMIGWAFKYLGSDYKKVLADGYVRFVTDVNKSQMRYERTGSYPNNQFDDVYKKVYGNTDYMRNYHWGVYLTTFLWEHHLHILDFYRKYFISRLTEKTGKILDLGSGSGIWDFLTLHFLSGWTISGIDISKTSIEFSSSMAKRIGFGKRLSNQEGDAINYSSSSPCDACISCFLLEHIHNPQELMNHISQNLKPRGYVFLTAALTAAEIDHINEFKQESEVIVMAEKAGLRVIASFSSSPLSYPQNYKYLPRSLALVLNKKSNPIW